MDNPGWHARHRAQKDEERWSAPRRGPDGRFTPVEHVYPMQEPFVGGFRPPPSPVPSVGGTPPPLPPKDDVWPQSETAVSNGHPVDSIASTSTQATTVNTIGQDSYYLASQHLVHMTAVERSENLRVAHMKPHLQFMAGPMLRYDTVDEQGVWRGAAMIVTADAGSEYDPHPTLTYSWDPSQNITLQRSTSRPRPHRRSFNLGPHPADPFANVMPAVSDQSFAHTPTEVSRDVPGKELWVYVGNGGTFTFWRFMIEVPLGPNEMRISYTVNHGQELSFYVPGRDQSMRLAAYSCNGFSSGVNPDDFRGPGFSSGYDPVWSDLLTQHAEEPFHVLVGGGDQLYCDGITREPEMQEWVTQTKPEKKKNYPLTEEMRFAIDRFYFNHYCHSFRSGAFARANSSIPMLNMLDDHDLIDGFGSYPDDLMTSSVFGTIGSRGYFFFLLFQCFINVDIDGLNDRQHPFKSLILGGDGPYVPFPSHSFLSYLGPHAYILMLDCRAERKKDQVCSQKEYKAVFERVYALPPQVDHLVIQLGIPIAYPRMVFLETALDSNWNPLVALGKSGTLGLSGFVNKFNSEAELLDDLNDHWTAKAHKRERNWFVEQLQHYAKDTHTRVSFLSGDVHCAAVGVFKTLAKGKGKQAVPPPLDYRYMVQIVSSAIVNTPPPNGVLTMVSTLSTKTHRTLHHIQTDETMLPVFEKDPNGNAPRSRYVMGRRNWCAVRRDPSSGDMVFDIRVEKVKGGGETSGYVVRAPPPRWSP